MFALAAGTALMALDPVRCPYLVLTLEPTCGFSSSAHFSNSSCEATNCKSWRIANACGSRHGGHVDLRTLVTGTPNHCPMNPSCVNRSVCVWIALRQEGVGSGKIVRAQYILAE